MPANTRSSKPTRQNSEVILLSDPDIFGAKRMPLPKQKQKNPARKENHCPVNSGEIIEISSDEDEEPAVARSVVATSKLKERIRILEQENARIRKENEEIKKQQTMATDMEEQVTCEVCSGKMWSPFILPDCGHTFCQQDLEDWFSTALKQHRNVYPNYNVNAPAVNVYGIMQSLPLPQYSCPKCREKVRSKPIQNFALKGLVRMVADQVGENSPKKAVGSSTNAWSRFFPAQ
ncbi:hypothetical protein DFH09DRAFT_193304 [Mycena vulgaris]|nr:hypothetical protein DFH09DRAFT_193304 [Mycena vulgaris]